MFSCNHCEQYATTVICFCCRCCCSTRTNQLLNNTASRIPILFLYSFDDPWTLSMHHQQCINQTCIINQCINHAPNLYHQPSALTMHQTTCHNNLINHIRSIHQDQSPRQLSTICTISPRCASTKTTHKHQQDVPQSICASKSISIHICTSSSMCQLASASNNVPSMYQSCINYRSSYDFIKMYQHHHNMCQPCTSTIYHTSYTMKCISTICQEYVPNVYQACI
jgi:hypothetical protein